MSALSAISRRALFIAATAAALTVSGAGLAGTVKVAVAGARNDNGVVRCGLFNSPVGWREPGKQFMKAEGKVAGGKGTCVFPNVPEGTYAVALFHAEQGERQVAFNMLGLPKQGVAFSNNLSITFGAPGFDKASFKVGKEPVDLGIKLIY